jgi:small-conductance mechanosensitive channel
MTHFLIPWTMQLEHFAVILFGPVADEVALGSITWADIAVGLFYLTVAAVIDLVVVYRVRRSAREPAAVGAKTRHRLFNALGRPLYVLIALGGLYVAATPALIRLHPDEGAEAMRGVLDFVFQLVAFASAFWFLFRVTRVLEARLTHWASTTASKSDDLLAPLVGSSLRFIVIVMAVILGIPLLRLPTEFAALISKLTSIVLIASIAAFLIRMVNIAQSVVLARFDMTIADNLRARKVYTQLHVISRVIYVSIGIFAVAAILMLFQEVRHVGTSLLASAGIVGIIAGVAAQKTLANLFAGFQIALAQPVRQDDVVVVEGEWGRVEEITLTYVVVHIWDDRRLVLPLSYFIEKPFQNWTRTSANIMGSVLVSVDYSFPVEEARAVLKQIIESSPLWDKRFWNLQVSDSTEKTMQLRVLATSSDSSRSWDLRCEIREKFIKYIQQQHSSCLPRLRADISNAATE